MRPLTPEEKDLWAKVTNTVTPLGEPNLLGFDVPFQLINHSPSWTLDLHGLTVYDAFLKVRDHIEEAYLASVRRLNIITGKSGVIRKEFPEWVNRYPVQRIELLSGGGSFRVFLQKKPEPQSKS